MTGEHFVTFRIRPHIVLATLLGFKTKYFAVRCQSEQQAKEVASDVYSIDGISYLKIKKSKRLRKDAIFCTPENYLKLI